MMWRYLLLLLVLPCIDVSIVSAETLSVIAYNRNQNNTNEILNVIRNIKLSKIDIKLDVQDDFRSYREFLQYVQYGKVEAALVPQWQLSEFDELRVFELPFLIRNRDHMREVVDRGLNEQLDYAFRERGLKLLAIFDGDFRMISSSMPLSLSTLKGLRIRTVGSSSDELFAHLGASPVKLPFAETYSALSKGVVDAVETTLQGVADGRLAEVSQHVTLSDHLYQPQYLIANLKWFDQLAYSDQKELVAAARAAGGTSFKIGAHFESQTMDRLRQSGTIINHLSDEDRNRLIEVSRRQYDEYASKSKGNAYLIEELFRQ